MNNTVVNLQDNRAVFRIFIALLGFYLTLPRTLISQIYSWNDTCLGQFLCPSSGVFHCTHTAMLYVILKVLQMTCMTYTIAVFTIKNS
jgi:hypothetical protein